MANHNIGGSNRLSTDNCAYQKDLVESVSPLAYQLYFGAHERCDRCIYDKFYTKYSLVDVESELLNITRPASKCDNFKYSKNCKDSKLCMSTFSKRVPVVLDPSICPIVYNNIPRTKDVGYTLPDPNFCRF
jgi:hypothetical protein